MKLQFSVIKEIVIDKVVKRAHTEVILKGVMIFQNFVFEKIRKKNLFLNIFIIFKMIKH